MEDATKPAVLPSLYEADFFAWTQQQAEALRRRDWSALDIDNLVEEVDSLGRQERSELRELLTALLVSLAKWHYLPQQRGRHGRSWRLLAEEQRVRIEHHLRDSPSLMAYGPKVTRQVWRIACLVTARETSLSYEMFPKQCPFTWEEVIREGWLPE